MLFSDIEGSTVRLGRLGEAYGEALSAQRVHRKVPRRAPLWNGRQSSRGSGCVRGSCHGRKGGLGAQAGPMAARRCVR